MVVHVPKRPPVRLSEHNVERTQSVRLQVRFQDAHGKSDVRFSEPMVA